MTVALVADVPDWAFCVNNHAIEKYVFGGKGVEHLYVKDAHRWQKGLSTYDAVFLPFHRWGLERSFQFDWKRILGSLRSELFYAERPNHKPGPTEFDFVNRHAAFHMVTKHNFEAFAAHCPNVFYLTNPVDTERFQGLPELRPEPVFCWSGNANHCADIKGFTTIIQPSFAGTRAPFVYAEYGTTRLPHHEMPGFFAKANVAVCASLYEGASNSVLEAMASGLALITTDVGNAREMHDSQMANFGKSGIRFIGRTVQSLSAAVEELRRDPERVAEMGALNQKEIQARWSWHAWADRYKEFFRKATE